MYSIGAMFNLDSSEPIVSKASIQVECSPIEMFRYLGEDFFQNYPKWSPEVKELAQISDGSIKLGSIARQVRIDAGYRSESKFSVTLYEPPNRLAFAGISEPFRCMFEVRDDNLSGKSSRLDFTFELLELQVLMRPFEQLIHAMVQNGAERTVQNIKRLIEADKPANVPRSESL